MRAETRKSAGGLLSIVKYYGLIGGPDGRQRFLIREASWYLRLCKYVAPQPLLSPPGWIRKTKAMSALKVPFFDDWFILLLCTYQLYQGNFIKIQLPLTTRWPYFFKRCQFHVVVDGGVLNPRVSPYWWESQGYLGHFSKVKKGLFYIPPHHFWVF